MRGGGSDAAAAAVVRVPSEWLLALLYGVTGAAALVHEVAWTRTARSLLGGDARALSVALIAILGGMGFGGLLAPRVARRWGALGGFARVEIAAALYAAALPWIAPALDVVVGAAFRSLGAGPGFTVASVLVATLLFTPPALAMGAGLPLLAQARAPAGRTPRDSGVLYAAHALGGAAGGLLAAFAFMPDLGVPVAVALASAAQLAVAVAALILRRPEDRPVSTTSASKAPVPGGAWVVLWLLGAALLAGIGTAALQTLAARVATLAVGPSVQGFALVAAVYVLALAAGAGLGAPFVRHATTPIAVYACLLVAAGAATLAGIATIGGWPVQAAEAFGGIAAGDGPPWASLGWMVLLPVFGPVALSAAAFPFGIAALARAGHRPAARDVGWLVAAGAAGNVLGVLATTFGLVPAVGIASALVVAAMTLAVSGMVAAVAGFRGAPGRPPLRPRHALALGASCAVVVATLTSAPARFDADTLTRGPFLYAGAAQPELGEVVFVHHGVEATVTVREAGAERLLQIDGKVDASALGDASTQLLVGLLPGLLGERPRDALVIGLGTGTTVDAVRSIPGMERIEVAELVDGVRWAAPRFAAWNGDVLRDERVRVRPIDGSLLLRHGAGNYDLVVSEPSNPWVAGMGDFFSEQTFRAARDRLADGGVLATWFHVYSTDFTIVRSIVATFLEVFPDATLWELVRGQDYLLVGHKQPESEESVHLDLDRMALRASERQVDQRLRRARIESTEGLLARLVGAGENLRALAADAPVLSARDGSLEARAARSLYRDASREALQLFADLPRQPGSLRVRAETEAGRALASALPAAIEAGGLGRSMVLHATAGREEAAIASGERAVGFLPNDPSLRDDLATLYLARGKTEALLREDARARDALMTVLELEPGPAILADALTTLGDLHLRGDEPVRALERYQRARRLAPTVVELTEKIADCLEAVGADDDARRERRLAARLRRAQM